jgi:hypothetical protein
VSVLSTEDLPLLREALATATPPVMHACLLPRSVTLLALVNSTRRSVTGACMVLKCIMLRSCGASVALQCTPQCQDIMGLIMTNQPSAVVIIQRLMFALPSACQVHS